ncbi:MAG: polymer-forming cytoskeletal family protein [Spirochaetaceae bacterium]|nr:MAG: polymer-forming cytoskeletal family protein [Spirochaetaceae bacterium]
MAEYLKPDNESVYSIIGEQTKFRGEFEVKGLLRIDGDFTGTIRAEGRVLISKNGRAMCTIYGDTVIVGGIVKGNIYAEEKVEILGTGMVIGTIETPRLVVNEGVVLHGTCRVTNQPGILAANENEEKRIPGPASSGQKNPVREPVEKSTAKIASPYAV